MKTLSLLATALLVLVSAALAQQPLPPLPADGFVSLEQIVKEFATQPDAALQKYNGARILVYGRVGKLGNADDDQNDPLAVYMQLPSQTTPDVKAIFTAANLPNANISISEDDTQVAVYHRNWEGDLTGEKSFISVGQTVGIKGTFDNFVAGDVVLRDSSKLDAKVLKKKLAEHRVSTE